MEMGAQALSLAARKTVVHKDEFYEAMTKAAHGYGQAEMLQAAGQELKFAPDQSRYLQIILYGTPP